MYQSGYLSNLILLSYYEKGHLKLFVPYLKEIRDKYGSY